MTILGGVGGVGVELGGVGGILYEAAEVRPMADLEPRYISVSYVAKTFNVSPRTVRDWIDRGDLASIKTPGGQHRILRSALEAYQRQENPRSAA